MLNNNYDFGTHVSTKIAADMRDAGDALSWMSNICGPHDLKVHNKKNMHFKHVGNILNSTTTTIGRIGYGTDVTIKVEDLNNSYSISLPVTGFQELDTGNGLIQSNVTSAIIISPASACELHISGNCDKTLVRISRQAMEYGLETLIGKSMSEPLVFDAKMYADIGSSSAWWRTIRYIETELLNADSLYNSPAFIRDIEQALIKGILTLQPHNYSDEIKQEVHKKLPAYLIKVIEYLKVNARHEIDIDDIEELSGVSISKLYSDFKRYIGMPPTAYLKRLRLEGVRADTMKCMGEENISTLAFSWGFNHLGRFSTEYRKMFGETPSQTQAKIKARLKL